jgi:hypothetical protein
MLTERRLNFNTWPLTGKFEKSKESHQGATRARAPPPPPPARPGPSPWARARARAWLAGRQAGGGERADFAAVSPSAETVQVPSSYISLLPLSARALFSSTSEQRQQRHLPISGNQDLVRSFSGEHQRRRRHINPEIKVYFY